MTTSIFNLNCWLFPPPISVDCNARLSAIIEIIKQRNPEVVCLQEVWSNKYLTYLQQELPNYHCVSSGTPFYNQTGLVTFLKEKPLSSQINYFKLSFQHNVTEWFLRKGYITIKTKLGGHEFTIINTHLYAAFSTGAEVITEKQFSEIIRVATQDNVILCGDLNLKEEIMDGINRGTFSRLCDSQYTLDANNPYGNKRFNKLNMEKKPGSKKIDYFLYKGNFKTAANYETIKAPFVSDHYPMFCRTSFS